MILKCTKAPENEPIDSNQVSGQCRVDVSKEEATVKLLIQAVRERAEAVTRRALLTQTWELVLDGFPMYKYRNGINWMDTAIFLPLPPLQKVNSIKYIDTNGNEQTLDPSEYKIVEDAEPAFIVPAFGCSWPNTYDESAVIRINFDCGYGDEGDNVPAAIRQWMLINVANLFENRETEGVAYRETKFDLSTLADGLIESYRILRV